MGKERHEHTLQATALVNEAYMRLVELKRITWQNRAHFLAMAARVMRRILGKAAAPGYQKRAAARPRHAGRRAVVSPALPHHLIALDEPLTALETTHQA